MKSDALTEVKIIFRTVAVDLMRHLLIMIRKIHILIVMEISIMIRPWSKKLWIFNLDLHTSLIEDLKVGLKDFNVHLVSWSVSGNNRNFRRFYKIPDPVTGISGKNWLTIGPSDLTNFREKYHRYLGTFDGFIACFPPAFSQIYTQFNKPILVYYGTRYEAPYSAKEIEWGKFNRSLKLGMESGLTTVVANNVADIDYFYRFTGKAATYLPSLCDYTDFKWRSTNNRKIVFARDQRIITMVNEETHTLWQNTKQAFGKTYDWGELSQVEEVLVIPYNISTMTLFELATAGIPVSVPSPRFLEELRLEFDHVLSELSFFEILGLPTEFLENDNPNRTNLPQVRKWWTDRADFYNKELMPNVRVIDSFSELSEPHPFVIQGSSTSQELVEERNSRIHASRKKVLGDFITQMKVNSLQ